MHFNGGHPGSKCFQVIGSDSNESLGYGSVEIHDGGERQVKIDGITATIYYNKNSHNQMIWSHDWLTQTHSTPVDRDTELALDISVCSPNTLILRLQTRWKCIYEVFTMYYMRMGGKERIKSPLHPFCFWARLPWFLAPVTHVMLTGKKHGLHRLKIAAWGLKKGWKYEIYIQTICH